ncbi:ribose 5-phosphate isomerase A [Neobacillus piezotolerans]|uniref:Ribose-5-phosphate isomerase A n=1 Tax=Neobacillus piezotolerans TaxID=2259171 RepID=A0A3D8GLE6_9BACI|nr:ribose-5-phosphate isomerase RpiA [Neobacillus piezotolerans]RDU35218.1 ribose 5-phosphate isomerase A [Neobacillus piezotolerans]
MNEKQAVGEKAVEFVKKDMVVGLGTGSTVFYTLSLLGKLVQQGLSIKGIPTSVQTEKLAKELNIPLTSFDEIDQIDIAIDGADEVSGSLDLIKGGGGALLREKIVAKAAKKLIIVADSTKLVDQLGSFPLPVEIVPFVMKATKRHIQKLGIHPELRMANGAPFITDNGNYILDCACPKILAPNELENNLNMIPGVVDNGLFIGMADMVITVDKNKEVILRERKQHNSSMEKACE